MAEHKIFGFRFQDGPKRATTHIECDNDPWDVAAFADHLSQNRPSGGHHVYIVQLATFVQIQDSRLQIDPEATLELSTLLKLKLGMPRRILRDHVERGTLFRFSEVFTNPKLPSEQEPNNAFTLPYFELRSFGGQWDRISFLDPKTGEFALSCGSTGRQIQVHEWHEEQKQGPLLIIPRKCTFWSRKIGENWDAVIICDPPLESIYAGGNEAIPKPLTTTFPYSKGYKDFIPRHFRLRSKSSPPRDSLFSDLCYYFSSYSHLLNDLKDPLTASLFPKKILAAHYCTVLGFLRHQVSSMQGRDWSIARRTQAGIDEWDTVETAWLKFRCTLIWQDIDRVLDALAVPKTDPDVQHYGDWRAWACDFQFLRSELIKCSESYEGLTGAMSALSGIIMSKQAVEETRLSKEETQRGLREQKSAKKLNVLTLILAPMAVTSSLFSMTGDYAPGEKRFGVYFMWALPFTLVVFFLAMVADWGYDAQADWSFKTLGKGIKSVLMSVSGRSKFGDDKENLSSTHLTSGRYSRSVSDETDLQSIEDKDITDMERISS